MEFNILPEGWSKEIFSEVIDINKRYTIKKGTPTQFVEMKAVPEHQRKIEYTEIRNFSSGTKFKKGDTLFSRITPCLENGKTAYCDILEDNEIAFGSTEFLIFSAKDNKTDSKFIYYLSRYEPIRQYAITNMNGTSGRQRVAKEAFDKFEILLPSFKEQQKIASILSAFDDKIELDNQMNKNLEGMAQSIFKSWFVDFEPFLDGEFEETELGMIPKNWTIAKLGDIVEQIKNSAKEGLDTENKPYVPIDQIDSKKLALTTYRPWEEAQSSLIKFEKNDILFGAMRAYFHKVCISPFYGITRTTCFVLRPRNNFDLSFSLMKIFEEKTIDFANSHSTGSTIPYAVWDNGLCDMLIILPPESIRKEFHNKVFSMLEKIRDSIFEIEILKKQRDTLLPKLMSGEIRV